MGLYKDEEDYCRYFSCFVIFSQQSGELGSREFPVSKQKMSDRLETRVPLKGAHPFPPIENLSCRDRVANFMPKSANFRVKVLHVIKCLISGERP